MEEFIIKCLECGSEDVKILMCGGYDVILECQKCKKEEMIEVE